MCIRRFYCDEAVDALEVKPDGTYVDGTFGRGGHSRLILERLGKTGRLIAMDRDLAGGGRGANNTRTVRLCVHKSFSKLREVLRH